MHILRRPITVLRPPRCY